MTISCRRILDEDTGIVVDTHLAMARESYQPGPLSRMEASIHHSLKHYISQMFDS